MGLGKHLVQAWPFVVLHGQTAIFIGHYHLQYERL